MTKGQRAVALKEAGFENAEIAALLDMPKSSVRRLISETRSGTGEGASSVAYALQEAQRPTKHLVIPDTQVRGGVPLDHLVWCGKYAAEQEPDVIVHLGDHWDFPSLSSYEQKGSKWFEGRRFLEDVEAGNLGLRMLTEAMGSFRPKRLVLLRGNHEDRLTRAINAEPKLEGVIGFHQLNDRELGWEVFDFLVPAVIDDLHYAHFWANPLTGRPYTGSIDNMLRTIGFSFVQGHRQGKWIGSRELNNGAVQRGLVAGSFYQHHEDYLGPQGNHHWRGVLVLHEVKDGSYDLMEVSLNYLQRRYG